ncbi:MAG: PBP1A family penicillin-binding protein [Gaiellaceae bacterium]
MQRRRIKRIRKLRLLVLLFVLGWVAVASFFFGLIFAVSRELPSLDPAHVQSGEVNGYIYDSTGNRVLAVLRGSQARVLVTANQISPWIKHAIVDIEDKRFYEHRGVDLHGILRAIWADIRQKGAVQGGSTITQQFVKNSLVHSQRTIARKLKEAALAWQLERHWTKTRILTAYLNTIYFGNGAYGIQTAATTYFGHGAATLTLPEAALLAGIPEDPSRWDPVTNPRAARARRETVLRAMLDQNHITAADFQRANTAPLPKAADVHLPGTQSTAAPYFTNYVTGLLINKFGSNTVFGAGLRVRTSIDLRLQQAARDAISKILNWSSAPSAALVAMDPRDGRVLAMIGGNNFHKSQFNLAVQGERQPGSSFKPFVLATALEEGIAPGSQLVSKPVTIYAGGTFWPVHNYEGAYVGPIDLQQATVDSDNSVYAQLTSLVGPPNVVRTAHRLGINSPLQPYLSIGLGAQAVNPLEMARAFGAFANGGFRIDGSITGNHPRAIVAVGDKNATDIECGKKHVRCNSVDPHRVLRQDSAELVNAILQQVVQRGTGRNAAIPGRPVAGKTGTTENYGDAWFVGYTPQLVTAVWVGYPDKLIPMTSQYHGQPVVGGTFPALIWKSFTQKALKLIPGDEQVAYFPPPPSMYGVTQSVVWRDGHVELNNGNCKQASALQFFSGRAPSLRANCKPNEVDVPHLVGKTLTWARLRLAAQPLTPAYVYKPAKPLQRLNIVLAQFPATGTLSSYDKVTLVLPRALWGVVPNVVGLNLRQARAKLRKAKLAPFVTRFTTGKAGVVVGQTPSPGLAAARHMRVSLVVGRTG